MRIERIEVRITNFTTRLQRQRSTGVYDTGAPGQLLGKPVLVKVYAEGIVGYGQIRLLAPHHSMPITPARKIAAIAEAADLKINCGGRAVLSQLEAAAGAHFYASRPAEHVMPAGEFIFGLGVIGPDPIVPENDFVVKDGHVRPPCGPGSGITVDESALDAHTLVKEIVQ
jgi:hypothetical protein